MYEMIEVHVCYHLLRCILDATTYYLFHGYGTELLSIWRVSRSTIDPETREERRKAAPRPPTSLQQLTIKSQKSSSSSPNDDYSDIGRHNSFQNTAST